MLYVPRWYVPKRKIGEVINGICGAPALGVALFLSFFDRMEMLALSAR
jgi:hypothetical protein